MRLDRSSRPVRRDARLGEGQDPNALRRFSQARKSLTGEESTLVDAVVERKLKRKRRIDGKPSSKGLADDVSAPAMVDGDG